jgi:hypothetical protein
MQSYQEFQILPSVFILLTDGANQTAVEEASRFVKATIDTTFTESQDSQTDSATKCTFFCLFYIRKNIRLTTLIFASA